MATEKSSIQVDIKADGAQKAKQQLDALTTATKSMEKATKNLGNETAKYGLQALGSFFAAEKGISFLKNSIAEYYDRLGDESALTQLSESHKNMMAQVGAQLDPLINKVADWMEANKEGVNRFIATIANAVTFLVNTWENYYEMLGSMTFAAINGMILGYKKLEGVIIGVFGSKAAKQAHQEQLKSAEVAFDASMASMADSAAYFGQQMAIDMANIVNPEITEVPESRARQDAAKKEADEKEKAAKEAAAKAKTASENAAKDELNSKLKSLTEQSTFLKNDLDRRLGMQTLSLEQQLQVVNEYYAAESGLIAKRTYLLKESFDDVVAAEKAYQSQTALDRAAALEKISVDHATKAQERYDRELDIERGKNRALQELGVQYLQSEVQTVETRREIFRRTSEMELADFEEMLRQKSITQEEAGLARNQFLEIQFNQERELDKQLQQEKIDNILEYADIAVNTASTIASSIVAYQNMQSQAVLKGFDKEKAAIQNSVLGHRAKQSELAKIEAKAEKERKAMARRQRGVDISMALINTALGFTKALAQGGILGIITGSAVAAAGAAQIATMVAQPLAKGGIVGGNSREGDRIPARLNSREMVLTEEQQGRLFSMANGGPGGGAQALQVDNSIIINGNVDRKAVERLERSRETQLYELRRMLIDLKYHGQLVTA